MADSYISKSIQRLVKDQSKGYCEYCCSPEAVSTQSFHLDHIVPSSKGGKSEFSNLAYCCGGCNGYKYDKIQSIDPFSKQPTSLFHPREHKWPEHFQWSSDDLTIEGISPIGRATIDLLQLNRIGNINLRKLLKLAGLHPPVI
jgi:hypothetical protein